MVRTPVPFPKTPNLEQMFRNTDDIIGVLLKLDDFNDSGSGVEPFYLNLSSLVPFRDGDGKVETDKNKGFHLSLGHFFSHDWKELFNCKT